MRHWDNGTPALNMEVHEYSVEPEHLTRVKRFDQFSFPYAFPGNVRDHLKKIANMKTREGDVLISTYPKSGQFDFFIVITRSINSLDLSQVLVHFPPAPN